MKKEVVEFDYGFTLDELTDDVVGILQDFASSYNEQELYDILVDLSNGDEGSVWTVV